VRRVPHVRRKIEAELARTKLQLELDMHKNDKDRIFFADLPESGLSEVIFLFLN